MVKKNKRARIVQKASTTVTAGRVFWLRIVGGNGEIQATTEDYPNLATVKAADADLIGSMIEILEDRGYVVTKKEDA